MSEHVTAMPQRAHPASARLLHELTGGWEGSVPALLCGRVAATPEAPFLSWGGRWWTYADALAECERVVGFLRESGLDGPQARIASYLANCPEAIWTWFGTLLAGCVYVPLNRSHRGALLDDMLRRSGAAVLVTDAGPEELPDVRKSDVTMVVTVQETRDGVPGVATEPYSSVLASAPATTEHPRPHELAAVMYTSGSTGRSKAVLIPHNQHARGAALIADGFRLRSSDVWHTWHPLYHVMGQLYAVLASVAAGGAVALQPRFSRSGFWREVSQSGCTVIGGLASVMRMIWTLPDDDEARDNPARLALVSGAFHDIHQAFEARYGVQVVDCYGMTEAEPMTLPVLDHAQPGCHGRETIDFEVAIADDEDRTVESGVAGEIVARPRIPSVMFSGYEGDAEQTVRAWRNLWFHTGDLGYLDGEGHLHFLDRRKHGIRRLGENISTWEIERLLHTAPGVASAVAVGIPAANGEEDVKAVIVRLPESTVTAEQVHAWCGEHMARFMVPRYIEFVEEFPRIVLGKVDRASLTEVGPGVWDAGDGSRAD